MTPGQLAEKYVKNDALDLDAYTIGRVKRAFIKGYEANQSKWISVDDALPEYGVEVIVLETKTNKYCPCIFLGSYETNGKENVWWKGNSEYSESYYKIIAWQSSPDFPLKP